MNQYSAMITDFLHKCGDADKEMVSENEWWVVSGSVKLQIFLTNMEENAELVVAANLFPYPEQNAEVNAYVLKLNGTLKLKGVSFGIRNQHLILSYVRPVQGLDPGELEWIIASIAVIADEYDDFLIEKFKL
ncbi:MAG: YbjN domain-containing protein [SAR324 cluster bacterium]|nr:YbjN domain-containing protein [SAR324 cluster bacterium]